MDTTPLERDLLQHRDFLLRLAAGLVGSNDAEDLVQDVWTKALEHPGTAARGWLARVARNLAVNRFRGRSRRERREREHAPTEPSSGPAEDVSERFELTQRVAAAVRTLEEPYRAVILLRFFEGLDHATMAARLGVPIATVRTRQQRALGKLRERLDRDCGGREAWSVLLAAWTAHPGGAVAAAGGGALLVAGVAALLGGAGLWLAIGHDDPLEPAPLVTQAQQGAAEREGGGRSAEGPAQPTSTASARQALKAEAPAAPRTLVVGRVEGLTQGELAEAHVEVEVQWKRLGLVRADVRPDGNFEAEVDALRAQWADAEPLRFLARVEHPLHLGEPVSVPFAAGVRDGSGDLRLDAGTLTMRDLAVLRGRVLRPDGSPAAGAELQTYKLDDGLPRETATPMTRCDDAGRFELRLEHGGELAVIALVEGLRPGHALAEARLGQALELADIVLQDGHGLAGRVLRLGRPMSDARVSVQCEESGHLLKRADGVEIAWLAGRPEWLQVNLETDAEGRFAGSGFARQAYQLEVHGSQSMGTIPMNYESLRVMAPSTDLALEFRACLVTLVRAPDSPGEVEGWLHVRAAGEELNGLWIDRASDERDSPAMTFVAPPATELELLLELEGLAPFQLDIVTPGPGQELRRTLAYGAPGPLATLELEWTPPEGVRLDALRMTFITPEGQLRGERRIQGPELENGRLRAEGVPPGRYQVRIEPGKDSSARLPLFPVELSLELLPGQTLRERIAFEPAGLLRVDVRAPSGARRHARFRLLDSDGLDGTAIFGALHPGDYELVVWDEDTEELRLPVRIVAGETSDVAVTLQPK